jgi:uncharacterized protein (DUF3820 family)
MPAADTWTTGGATEKRVYAMYAHSLPFGKHRGQPLATVPSDYLQWLMRTCRLSSGLRAAVSAELARRGLESPPVPKSPAPPACRDCGAVGIVARWQEDSRGERRIRGACLRCGRYLCWLPNQEPWVGQADAVASKTPLLDALTRLEALGVELESDGQSVSIRWPDWQRVPQDLAAVIRQCSHQLARLLGDTRRKGA